MDREIEILEYRIAECDKLLLKFDEYGISQKKIDKITAKRAKYQAQLDILLA